MIGVWDVLCWSVLWEFASPFVLSVKWLAEGSIGISGDDEDCDGEGLFNR